jgi:hypothetical protein
VQDELQRAGTVAAQRAAIARMHSLLAA